MGTDGVGGPRATAGHEPALDGIRGLAVAAVLLFHGGFAWAEGGYLGVSTFFTLSGFLITRVLLDHHERTGSVGLRTFWVRRARRLWPASLAALGGTILLARLAFDEQELVGFRGDLLASVLQVANWRFLIDGRSYGALFESPSLLQHFWSLAIEEQLYLVVPLLVAGGLSLGRGRTPVAIGVGVLMAASMAATVLLQGSDADRIYYGTDTRAFELLAGVLLALVVRDVPAWDGRSSRVGQALGWTALAGSVVAWATVAQGSAAVSSGGLWLYTALSIAFILGARTPGPLQQALAWRPLARLGVISYGVYLFHWPLFLWLSPERLGTSRLVAFGLGTAITLSLAVISHTLLEDPIRSRRAAWLGAAPRPTYAAVAAFAVLLLATPTLAPAGDAAVDVEGTAAELEDALEDGSLREGVPVVGVFGDSTAVVAAFALFDWGQQTGEIQIAKGSTFAGCGLVTEGTRLDLGVEKEVWAECGERDERYTRGAEGIDLAVYVGGAWDTTDYRLPGESDMANISDPEFRAHLAAEAERVFELVTADGAELAWVIVPDIERGVRGGRSPAEPDPASDPARIALYNEIGRELAQRHPDAVTLIDLRTHLESLPGGAMDRQLRPDGVHLTKVTAAEVTTDFLGPAVADAVP